MARKKGKGKGSKGRRGSTTSAKPTAKAKRGGRRLSAADKSARKKRVAQRVKMHAAAALLADFHGGRAPIKSGCGRPRGS